MATIRLKHSDFENFGSGTLAGLYAIAAYGHKGEKNNDPGKLVIEVEQTDRSYRAKNGPAVVLMPEFGPMCLIQDALSLASQGVEIVFKVVEVGEPS